MIERNRLKCGGHKRRKALFGEAITAAATLTAAGINALATKEAAKTQANAMLDNAKTQANVMKEQITNSNNLQKEQFAFTRSQNQENRQQQQDIQNTLQMIAGKSNMSNIMERNKMQAKMGKNANSTPFYGGAPFQVTDGGGVLPIDITPDGYGLYEIIGNDHEHYHKTKRGKSRSGVGFKFKDGTVIEGEGNQNSNLGELLYVTPQDAMFLSKHSIKGFNPAKAVLAGLHPMQAFNTQEYLKRLFRIKDNGDNMKYGGIANENVSYTSSPVKGIDYSRPTAKCGGKRKLKCGGRRKAAYGGPGFYDYMGAGIGSAGNILGSLFSTWGNISSANKLNKAYLEAGNLLSDAYSQMKGIDLNEVKMEDYAAPHTLAVIRDPNVNIEPQLERIRRNAISEQRAINAGTLSSAARQQRLAATNDRTMQRSSEQYAYKDNEAEKIKQANADAITRVVQANADRDVQARKDFTSQRLSLLQYNNDIANARIAGMAQAKADAITQGALARAQGVQQSLNAVGSALNASGQLFGTATDNYFKTKKEDAYAFAGLSSPEQKAFIMTGKAPEQAKTYYNQQINIYDNATNIKDKAIAFNNIRELVKIYPQLDLSLPKFDVSITNPNNNNGLSFNQTPTVIFPNNFNKFK